MRLQSILDWAKSFWDKDCDNEIFHLDTAVFGELIQAVQALLAGFNVLLDGHRKQFGIATDKKPAKVRCSGVVSSVFH